MSIILASLTETSPSFLLFSYCHRQKVGNIFHREIFCGNKKMEQYNEKWLLSFNTFKKIMSLYIMNHQYNVYIAVWWLIICFVIVASCLNNICFIDSIFYLVLEADSEEFWKRGNWNCKTSWMYTLLAIRLKWNFIKNVQFSDQKGGD